MIRFLCLFIACFLPIPALALPFCEPSEAREAARFRGELTEGNQYTRAFAPGWSFALMPNRHGWSVRIFDADGLDLSQITPPYRGAPNARDIEGWHFRNAENTGPNEGSVNAPQKLRLFFFDPALSGTGGFKPSAATADVNGPGRAALEIRDFDLTPPKTGERARITRLSFDACLSWPATGTTRLPDAETVEQMRACGLPEALEIVARLDPVALEGDFDGDGSLDLAAQVIRHSDGKNGIAVCRAGTWLHTAGLDGAMGELVPEYFDRMDYWGLHRGAIQQGAVAEAPPEALGEAILLGKEEASSVLVYWRGDGFWSYWQGD